MTDLPIVCSLTPAALKARREGLLVDLVRRAQERQELAGGYRFRFAASENMLSAVATWLTWSASVVVFSVSQSSLNQMVDRFR